MYQIKMPSKTKFRAWFDRLICRLTAHQPRPVTDYLTDEEKEQRLYQMMETGKITFSRCARCGFEK